MVAGASVVGLALAIPLDAVGLLGSSTLLVGHLVLTLMVPMRDVGPCSAPSSMPMIGDCGNVGTEASALVESPKEVKAHNAH